MKSLSLSRHNGAVRVLSTQESWSDEFVRPYTSRPVSVARYRKGPWLVNRFLFSFLKKTVLGVTRIVGYRQSDDKIIEQSAFFGTQLTVPDSDRIRTGSGMMASQPKCGLSSGKSIDVCLKLFRNLLTWKLHYSESLNGDVVAGTMPFILRN